MGKSERWVAMDLALIPEKSEWPFLAELNGSLPWPRQHGFHFDAHHWPHVTLWQDFVLSGKIPDLVAHFETSGWQIPGSLTFSGISSKGKIDQQGFTPGLVVEDGAGEVQALHQLAIARGAPFGGQGEVARGEFFGAGPVHERCHQYVQKYVGEKSGTKFSPHLTLGLGESVQGLEARAREVRWPLHWQVGQLVLAQLGDLCTVSSKIYWSREIS